MTEDEARSLSDLTETYERLKTQVDKSVNQVAEHFLESLDMEVPSAVATNFLTAAEGGKRFRAFAAISGAATAAAINDKKKVSGAASRTPSFYLEAAAADPHVMNLGVALEFYQGAALVHDDIIDRSDTRRGRPTTHVAMAKHHGNAGLAGDANAFGTDSAILVGDLLLAGADFALAQALKGLEGSRGPEVLELYARMAGEVSAGQYLDAAITYAPVLADTKVEDLNQVLEQTLAVVKSKSARYSVVNPALLGATIAGGDKPLLRSLQDILEPAGVAFQLRDDELGVSGVEKKTGKPTGIDVREGKRTVLLALTLANASKPDARVLAEVYTADPPTDQQVNAAVEIITQTGSGPHEQLIADFLEASHTHLERANLPAAGGALVHYLTSLLVERSH